MYEAKRRQRKVKIAVTLGPSSSEIDIIRKLFLSGADVFRINMSHGSKNEITHLHRMIREIEEEFKKPICIMADLQGPKLRCGDFKNKKEILKKDQKFFLDSDRKLGTNKRVFLPHPEIF